MKKLPNEYIVKCDRDLKKCAKVYSNFYNDGFDPGSWTYIVCSPRIKNAQFKKSGKYPNGLCIEDSIRDEFKHLPVLSYKEWEDSVSGEKKIVGYKLNELGKKNEQAALIVTERNDYGWSKSGMCDFFAGSAVALKAEKAGVLDLWFEPVYNKEEPVFKVGDWVILTKEAYTLVNEPGDCGQITEEDFNCLRVTVLGRHNYANWCHSSVLRHATPEEIKATLLAEAKRRYPVGTKYICPSGKTEEVVTKQHFKVYDIDEEIIHGEIGRGCLMFDGKWAEIITEPKRTKKEIKKEIKNLLKQL